MKTASKRNPWAWIPTLYFAQGLPYVAVMTISVIMYKRLGISNTDIALYTGWLYLPWVIKPFWSPFVDIIKSKRWWTLTMQWIIAFALAGIAFTIPTPFFFQLTLAIFWIVGFTSATHDIAADGFYMLALTEHEQSLYVGIRSTFYRVATVAGQGLLVIVAGLIETNSGLEPITVSVNADPAVEWSAPNLDAIYSTEPDLMGEMQFFTPQSPLVMATETPEDVTADIAGHPVKMSFAEYAKVMRDSVKHMNERNGFVAAEVPAATAQTAQVATPAEGPSAFTTWVKETFGEEREPYTARNNNFAIVGVRLNKQPAPGEEIVLNVTHKSGDQSIKLEQNYMPTRFVFTDKNWDKPAYLFYEADHKLTERVEAHFEGASGNIPMAWLVVFAVLSAFFFIVAIYHSWALPHPASDGRNDSTNASSIMKEFFDTFKTFFQKPQAWIAIAFMLLYRLPEAQLVKLINPFLLDPIDKGGLGLTTGQVGIVYGTVGIIGLTIGGIIGGIVAAKGGLKKWLWPMAWSMSLTCLTFVYLSYAHEPSLLTVNICVFIEQFGYGFGFTAYMLYLIYFSEGKHKTAHYAICTGFMALGMMIPGMAAGWLQETIGYRHFFIWTMICCAATIGICAFLKIDPNFGRKTDK
ncbi:MAG: AmpG family muropeptide MFS transporter [Bacteroidales bacterium]|nr:AmpG family muropeptide MFS transporter [Bacteroidales bacterium]MBD5215996.1 AmpG family muropeptide MFS transporter [Bacteroidales bacterium]